MDRLLPADTMHMVYSVLDDVLSSHRGTWLSFGMLGTIWTASAAFDSMIEALDIAYDVQRTRPFWKSRLLAIGLGAICGALLLAALAVMVVGPRFGEWLAERARLLRGLRCRLARHCAGQSPSALPSSPSNSSTSSHPT